MRHENVPSEAAVTTLRFHRALVSEIIQAEVEPAKDEPAGGKAELPPDAQTPLGPRAKDAHAGGGVAALLRGLKSVQGQNKPSVRRLHPAPPPVKTPVPPGYTVPANVPVSVPASRGERIAAKIGLAALAPVYFAFALLVLLPSLIGGFIDGARADRQDGGGTFMAGFGGVFRTLMSWLNVPVAALMRTANKPTGGFFVDRTTDPNNVIITVRIRLTGDPKDVAKVQALEQDLEQHLGIPGHSVNVEFVSEPGPGVSTIAVNPNVWSNSKAWNPYHNDTCCGRKGVIDGRDAEMIAHELMHNPLGLEDEYSLKTHFTNEQMGFGQRFEVFLGYLWQPSPPRDAAQGIMHTNSQKPLARHYREILG